MASPPSPTVLSLSAMSTPLSSPISPTSAQSTRPSSAFLSDADLEYSPPTSPESSIKMPARKRPFRNRFDSKVPVLSGLEHSAWLRFKGVMETTGSEFLKAASCTVFDRVALLQTPQGYQNTISDEEQVLDICEQERVGSGQWSHVYKVKLSRTVISQAVNSVTSAPRSIFALKVASSVSARRVIHHEAQHLETISRSKNCSRSIVEFFGYDPKIGALVLEYIPLSLQVELDMLEPPFHKLTAEILAESLFPMAVDLIDGLAFLHGKGIVHGDIKPGNILLRAKRSPFAPQGDKHRVGTRFSDEHGQPTVEPVYCDFGAADSTLFPNTTPSAGTYEYMAPEQFSTKKDESRPTTSSDVFSLGSTLVFAVTGRSPYAAIADCHFMQRIATMQLGKPLEFAMQQSDAAESLSIIPVLARANDGGEAKQTTLAPACRWICAAVMPKPKDRISADDWVSWSRDLVEADDDVF